MLIRDFGNCGNFDKLNRINTALTVAQDNHTAIVIVLDEKVYGHSVTRFDEVTSYDFNKTDIIINGMTFPWWDIIKVNLIF